MAVNSAFLCRIERFSTGSRLAPLSLRIRLVCRAKELVSVFLLQSSASFLNKKLTAIYNGSPIYQIVHWLTLEIVENVLWFYPFSRLSCWYDCVGSRFTWLSFDSLEMRQYSRSAQNDSSSVYSFKTFGIEMTRMGFVKRILRVVEPNEQGLKPNAQKKTITRSLIHWRVVSCQSGVAFCWIRQR